MDYIESSTLRKIKKIDKFADVSSEKSRNQNIFTIIGCIEFILLWIMTGLLRSNFCVSLLLTGVISFTILTFLTKQMIVAERNLQELRFLSRSDIKADDNGGITINHDEKSELAQFVAQTEKFMILYVLVKTINWIVFLVCSISLVFQIINVISSIL